MYSFTSSMVSLGHVRGHRDSTGSNRSSVDEGMAQGAEDETTVVEPEQGNVLLHIISQLRPGADLSRVVLPTFILEPRSMLERITNFMAHPETLLPMPTIDDPVERFVSVVKFYLSGWHIKPPGVKKPLNPILGETFTCYWEYPDHTKGYYISEQTSHHPPKSSYFFMAPEHNIRIDGTLKPRSKFLGNSAASMMEGIAVLTLMNRGDGPKGERYFLTQPNMYARGILFGKMKYELGDHSFVRCPELGLSADLEFKTKGYFSGTYNAIGGTIKNDKTGEVLFELSGLWNTEMFMTNKTTGKKELLFSVLKNKPTPPLVRPLEDQDERESQKLWFRTAEAVKARNHELATDEKTAVEEMQRSEAAKRLEDGVEWHPRLFRMVRGGPGGPDEGEEDLDWILNAHIDGSTPEKKSEQILAVAPILKGQNFNQKNVIPPRRSLSTTSSERQRAAVHADIPEEKPHLQLIKSESDLIDFGQHDTAPPVNHTNPPLPADEHRPQVVKVNLANWPLPADLHHAQTEHDRKLQKDLEATFAATSTSQSNGTLLDFHNDLAADLPTVPLAATVVKRHNSDTDSIDEFVDAEG